MPTPWQNLKTQIALAPYNAQSDATNQAALNALSVTQDVNGAVVYASLSPSAVRMALGFTNTEDWGWIVQIARNFITTANNDGAHPVTVTGVTQRACIHFETFFAPGAEPIPMNAARVTQLNAGLTYLSGQSVNVISATGAAAVTALMTSSVPWTTANGFVNRQLDFNDFNLARAS
jgi:hypothetical protein